MSFRCQKCYEAQPPRTTPHVHVAQTRLKQYSLGHDVALGSEIVREVRLCSDCYEHITKKREEAAADAHR